MSWLESLNFFEQGQTIIEKAEPRESSEYIEGFKKKEMVGDPEKSAEVWHLQEHPMSCAVACQEFVAEELLGKEFSESKMRSYAENNAWFSDGGTKMYHVGNLLEAMGLGVERTQGATIEDLKEVLKSGGKVMVGVNNMALENPLYAKLPGCSANHMVEVTGIDERDPKHIKVYLNDPGVKNGAGREIDLNTFQAAWKTSNTFMVSAFRQNGGKAL